MPNEVLSKTSYGIRVVLIADCSYHQLAQTGNKYLSKKKGSIKIPFLLLFLEESYRYCWKHQKTASFAFFAFR